jgi:hypothetical protein
MANKRDLKKYIKNVCGDIAGECIFAKFYFDGVDCEKMDDIIVKAAIMQTNMIDKVSVTFDKTPKSFDNACEYKKARKAYFKGCYNQLKKELNDEVNAIVAEMNGAMTNEQKAANKEALNK